MSDLKICTKCHEAKDLVRDFYLCGNRWRSECKACAIKRNGQHQRESKYWKHRYESDDERREYMREYYNKNKSKFARYRAEFKERYPEYYKEYFRDQKEKKSAK